MAKKSSNSNNNQSSNKKSSSGISLNKVSFYTICAVAFLYLLAMVFSLIKVDALATVARILQNIASAVVICIAAVNAWRFVQNKQTVWKVLYILVLLVILIGIVIPLCI